MALPYSSPMDLPPHTIVETASYLASTKGLLTGEDRVAVIDRIASDPTCGDLIVGGGGVRKVRFAIANKGKSGGARILFCTLATTIPCFCSSPTPRAFGPI
jgi:hypothetical protein